MLIPAYEEEVYSFLKQNIIISGLSRDSRRRDTPLPISCFPVGSEFNPTFLPPVGKLRRVKRGLKEKAQVLIQVSSCLGYPYRVLLCPDLTEGCFLLMRNPLHSPLHSEGSSTDSFHPPPFSTLPSPLLQSSFYQPSQGTLFRQFCSCNQMVNILA